MTHVPSIVRLLLVISVINFPIIGARLETEFVMVVTVLDRIGMFFLLTVVAEPSAVFLIQAVILGLFFFFPRCSSVSIGQSPIPGSVVPKHVKLLILLPTFSSGFVTVLSMVVVVAAIRYAVVPEQSVFSSSPIGTSVSMTLRIKSFCFVMYFWAFFFFSLFIRSLNIQCCF